MAIDLNSLIVVLHNPYLLAFMVVSVFIDVYCKFYVVYDKVNELIGWLKDIERECELAKDRETIKDDLISDLEERLCKLETMVKQEKTTVDSKGGYNTNILNTY